MQKRTKCEHGKFKWNCDPCGGLKRCEKHGRVMQSCRICHPKLWAQRILTTLKRLSRKSGHAGPTLTPPQLLKMLESSPICCGCNAPLDYNAVGWCAPCLHHNHETGEVIGFAHRECNSLEGQLQKLGTRLPIFLKNFFPTQVGQ